MALVSPKKTKMDLLAQNKYAPVVSMLSYSFFSISITLFNKALLTTYGYDSTITLTFLQGLVTVLSLQWMKWKGWVNFPDFNWKTALAVLPLSVVFVSYVVISLIALSKVNVPMFTALRRLTIIFVMIEEYFYFGTIPTRPIVNSVIIMTIGALIAAWKDLTFDIVSYTWLFFTNVTTSLYTVYINVVKKQNPQLNVFGMMYYTSITTLPAVLLFAIVTGDWQRSWAFKGFWDFGFQVCFQASIFIAFGELFRRPLDAVFALLVRAIIFCSAFLVPLCSHEREHLPLHDPQQCPHPDGHRSAEERRPVCSGPGSLFRLQI
jgi:solute carrier family 35